VRFRKSFILAAAVLIAAVLHAQAPDRKELLGNPRYMFGATPPRLARFTPDSLRAGVAVMSSRADSWIGYNDPEVRLVLPDSDNSAYAVVEFSEPSVVSRRGKAVKHQVEQSPFDPDSSSLRIRFRTPSGKGTVGFAHAVGTATVRYPLSFRTVTVRKAKNKKTSGVRFDGPFVTWDTAIVKISDPAPDSRISPVRAYDIGGRRLGRHDHTAASTSKGREYLTAAFWGQVAEVQFDVVERWATLNISYDVVPAPPLPAKGAGTATAVPAQMPGSKVEIAVAE
jgi:hypothetical protein